MRTKKRILVRAAATAGNVVYSYTVPAGYSLKLAYGHILLTTDATVANRRVKVGLYDSAGVLITDIHAGATVPASQTDQHMELMQGIYRETALTAGTLQVPIPRDWQGDPGETFRITVDAGVAGDSYTAALSFEQV